MADGGRSPDTGRNINVKLIALGAFGALLVIFAALNTHEVGVDWIFDTVSVPMILVISVSALLGFAIGWLVRGHFTNRD
jgi:uncharacterized integral membrane protein